MTTFILVVYEKHFEDIMLDALNASGLRNLHLNFNFIALFE